MIRVRLHTKKWKPPMRDLLSTRQSVTRSGAAEKQMSGLIGILLVSVASLGCFGAEPQAKLESEESVQSEESAIQDPATAAVDLVWRHDTAASQVRWLMYGAHFLDWVPIEPAVNDANWRLATTGDFDGDGNTDYAWRHSDGQNLIWFLREDGSFDRWSATSTVGDSNWRIVGAADVNRDGRADLVWRHGGTGENLVWFMNGAKVASWASLLTVPLDWSLRGAGDLDGDGRVEFVWRNANGSNLVWFMRGTNGTTFDRFDMLPVTSLDWRLDAVGDVDVDGKADLLWRNTTSGENVVWFMDGATIAKGVGLGPPVGDAGWRIAGTRRRALHGTVVTASPGTVAYERGVRRWIVQMKYENVEPQVTTRDTLSRVRVFGIGAERPILFGQFRMPHSSFFATPITSRTYGAVMQALDLRPFSDARTDLVSSTDARVHFDLYASLASENPASATPFDGPPADGSWSACDGPAYATTLAILAAAGAVHLCAPVAITAGSACVGSLSVPLFAAAACPAAAASILEACAPVVPAFCALSSSVAALWCCVGLDQRKAPLGNGCLASPVSATCECHVRSPGTHTSIRDVGLFLSPEYRCAHGSWKMRTKQKDWRTFYGDSASWKCWLPSATVGFDYYQDPGTPTEWDFGSWDERPVITDGKFNRGGGVCTHEYEVVASIISGKRGGVPYSQQSGFTRYYQNADHFSSGAEDIRRTVHEEICQGWSDLDPATGQVDADSDFEKRCPNFPDDPPSPPSCIDPELKCAQVGWQ